MKTSIKDISQIKETTDQYISIKILGKQIKALRQGQNVSQKKLAELAEINRGTLIRLEQGKITNPKLRIIANILDSLGYQLDIRIVSYKETKRLCIHCGSPNIGYLKNKIFCHLCGKTENVQ